MTNVYIVFDRGTGQPFHRLIRCLTRSPFVHCDIVRAPRAPRGGDTVEAVGAGPRGVCAFLLTLDVARHVIVAVPWANANTWDRAYGAVGSPYDYLALALTHVLNFRLHVPGWWFCSELCAYALGMGLAHSFAPGRLHVALTERAALWSGARTMRPIRGARPALPFKPPAHRAPAALRPAV